MNTRTRTFATAARSLVALALFATAVGCANVRHHTEVTIAVIPGDGSLNVEVQSWSAPGAPVEFLETGTNCTWATQTGSCVVHMVDYGEEPSPLFIDVIVGGRSLCTLDLNNPPARDRIQVLVTYVQPRRTGIGGLPQPELVNGRCVYRL